MRALQRAIGIGLAFSLAAFAGTACTLASPTYITAEQGASADKPSDEGSDSKTESTNSGTAKSVGATCATDDFTKPDVAKLTACGDGKGHCFAKEKVSIGDILTACPGSSTDVCVPDDILASGGEKPKSCTSIIGAGGCVTASLIPEIQEQGGSALKQDVCAAGQLCVPCTDPTNGNAPTPFCQPIGVHEKACSASSAPGGGGTGGSTPAQQGCCTSKGKSNGVCLTETAIPEGQRDDAPQDSCADGNKCVPKAFVEGKPVACKDDTFGKGVCMDECFSDMMSAAGTIGILDKGGACGSTELCVPCTFLSGQGVPGCQ
jgi:hypothetical protein